MNMLKNLSTYKWSISTACITLLASPVYAELPTTAPPTRGGSSGNYLEFIQNYAYDFLIIAGLAVAVITFFIVAKNVLSAYSEISTGRGTWGAVGMNAGAGVLIIVFVVFLLTEAAKVL